ncbi:hypothetical protein [Draconibacterium orientale]|uniref:hypothetical protein n=1 Tax=Draconibacterium orientale TaxID=1168034 RepID=UPI002A0A8C6E|nr:hypothetical protein [Draconibacterium orientale]
MKKQILFLTLFVAAILGGNNAYGQSTVEYDDVLTTVPTCITPTTLTCFGTASALTPVAGREYTYTITSEDTDAANNTEKVHWFVVDNADLANGIIDGTGTAPSMAHLAALIDPADGSEWLVSAETGVYNIPVTDASPNTADEISLTWNYFDGQNNVILLVAYVYDAVDCTNNIEVYRIFPQIQFTLDIAAIDQDAGTVHGPTDDPANECVSPIESAVYTPANPPSATGTDAPGDGLLTVDYGENYAYFMVNAANFTGAWNPLFDFTYNGVGKIVNADWTYPSAADNDAATWNAIDISGGDGYTITDATSTPIIAGGGTTLGVANNAAADLDTVGVNGECIIVRVRIDHGTSAENTLLKTLTVTVDGTMYDPTADPADAYATASLEDFGAPASGTGSCEQIDNDDVITFEITPRPNVITTDPTPFEQNTGDNDGTGTFTPVTPNTGSSTN